MLDVEVIPETARLQDEEDGVKWYIRTEGINSIHYMEFEGRILMGSWAGPYAVFCALTSMFPEERAKLLTHDACMGAIKTCLADLRKITPRPTNEEGQSERLVAKYKEKARKAHRPLIQKKYQEIASFLEMYPPEQVARMFRNLIKTHQEWKKQEPDLEIRRLLHGTIIHLYREALKDLTV